MAECADVVASLIKCIISTLASSADEGVDGPVNATNFDDRSAQAIPAVVRMFSGCKDAQTSADVFDTSTFALPEDAGPGGAGGACTNAMLSCLLRSDAEGKRLTWLELLEGMRTILSQKNFTQVPQLSGSRPLELTDAFSLDNEAADESSQKLAVLIGINYVGQQGELRGCHNDVIMMRKYIEEQGFSPSNTRVLMDDGEHESPTLANILAAFAWITDNAKPGDALFVHYSGHGGSVADSNGDERDGKDETLIPVDFRTAGQLSDDLILANLVLEVPRNAVLTVVIDACHSGTVLDLPYSFVADESTMSEVASGALPASLGQNPTFNFSQIFRVGKMLYDLHKSGASKQQIMQAAISQFPGVFPGSLGALASKFASGGFI